MGNIFSEIDGSRIFKNEEVLLPDHLPDILPHRDGQIKLLADNLLPAAKGRKPQNTFIFGPPGIGKTHVAKYVFREFEEFSERVKTVYVNCWDFKTAVAILSQIISELGFLVQRRGWAKDEIIERFREAMGKVKKNLIVCLDEVDQIEQEALYDLLRINQYVKNQVGLVFISNNVHAFSNLEPRIQSSLNLEEIEFKAYSIKEMKDILDERAKHAFVSVGPGVVVLCASHALQKGGDVRVGLECLLKAGRSAEKDSANQVKVEHVKRILESVKDAKPEILKNNLNWIEKDILKCMKKGKTYTSGELYELYCESVEKCVSDRKFRDCINHLALIGLVEVSEKTGIHGKTRNIMKV